MAEWIYNPADVLTIEDKQAYQESLTRQADFLIEDDYGDYHEDIRQRKEAMKIIVKYSRTVENFDAFIPYLAMNYVDRYISRYDIPKLEETPKDDSFLFALCCLILAWKMRRCNFSVDKFLKDGSIDIDRRHIKYMELYIIRRLDWRMRSITPICFIPYYVSILRKPIQEPLCSDIQEPLCPGFTARSINELIVQSQGDIKFTKFKPSVIAASAVLTASSILYPIQYLDFKKLFLQLYEMKQEPLQKCLKLMERVRREKNIVILKPGEESKTSRSSKTRIKGIVIRKLGKQSKPSALSTSRKMGIMIQEPGTQSKPLAWSTTREKVIAIQQPGTQSKPLGLPTSREKGIAIQQPQSKTSGSHTSNEKGIPIQQPEMQNESLGSPTSKEKGIVIQQPETQSKSSVAIQQSGTMNMPSVTVQQPEMQSTPPGSPTSREKGIAIQQPGMHCKPSVAIQQPGTQSEPSVAVQQPGTQSKPSVAIEQPGTQTDSSVAIEQPGTQTNYSVAIEQSGMQSNPSVQQPGTQGNQVQQPGTHGNQVQQPGTQSKPSRIPTSRAKGRVTEPLWLKRLPRGNEKGIVIHLPAGMQGNILRPPTTNGGPSQPHVPEASGERSMRARTKGKEPMGEVELVAKKKGKEPMGEVELVLNKKESADAEVMNFKLKWLGKYKSRDDPRCQLETIAEENEEQAVAVAVAIAVAETKADTGTMVVSGISRTRQCCNIQ